MKRKSLDTANCPIARTLDVIGDWWSLLIVRDAFLGKRRFNEFHKSLGLAKNILCVRLQKFVSHRFFTLGPASDGSAYQEYALTEKRPEAIHRPRRLAAVGGKLPLAGIGRGGPASE